MLSERTTPTPERAIDLEQQAAFLQAVAERASASAIVGKDLTGRVVSWSREATALYGYDVCEMLGTSAALLHGPDVLGERVSARYAEVLASGKWEGRVRRYRKDGSSFPANLTLLLRRDPAGKPCGLVSISRDLSEVERIARELDESRAHEARMLDSRVDLLVVADFDGKVWDVNPLTCGTTGRARSVWLGFELQGKFADPVRAEALLKQTLLQDEVHDYELALLNARGERLRVRCDALALPGKNRHFDRILIAMHPLTGLPPTSASVAASDAPGIPAARPGLASTLRSQPAQTEYAEQSLSSITPPPIPSKSTRLLELSHELRIPLNAIIGFAELLRNGKAGIVAPAHREYLEDILNSARHMQRLLSEGPGLSTVPFRPLPESDSLAELATLASEVCDGLKLLALGKRIEVRVELQRDLLLPAEHATKVRQILYNYLSNALRFSAEGAVIWLRCFRLDEHNLRLELEDTGPGISQEDQVRLFTEFGQAGVAEGLRRHEPGMGLAISRRLAEALGGSVSVESTLGKGSVFGAVIPAATLPAADLVSNSERAMPESETRLLAAPSDGSLTESEVCCA